MGPMTDIKLLYCKGQTYMVSWMSVKHMRCSDVCGVYLSIVVTV